MADTASAYPVYSLPFFLTSRILISFSEQLFAQLKNTFPNLLCNYDSLHSFVLLSEPLSENYRSGLLKKADIFCPSPFLYLTKNLDRMLEEETWSDRHLMNVIYKNVQWEDRGAQILDMVWDVLTRSGLLTSCLNYIRRKRHCSILKLLYLNGILLHVVECNF